MNRSIAESWLLPFLRVVQTRPGMYLGDESVRTLANYIEGYEQAREDLGFGRYGTEGDVLGEFGLWLKERVDTPKELTWSGYVQQLDQTESSVRTFFLLFAQFLEEKGRVMPTLEEAARCWPVHRPFR
jgi:hypothetical protein